MLHPHNGNRLVAMDSVTSLHPQPAVAFLRISEIKSVFILSPRETRCFRYYATRRNSGGGGGGGGRSLLRADDVCESRVQQALSACSCVGDIQSSRTSSTLDVAAAAAAAAAAADAKVASLATLCDRTYAPPPHFLSLFPHRSHVSFSLFFFVRCPRSL